MSEDPVIYKKQKVMYLVYELYGTKKYLFGNIKAVLSWFTDQELWGRFNAGDYDRVVRILRDHKAWTVVSQGNHWSIVSVPVVGQYVKSAKRTKKVIAK